MNIMKNILMASAMVATLSSNGFAANKSDLSEFVKNAQKFGTATCLEFCSTCNKSYPTEWSFEGKTVSSNGNHHCPVLDALTPKPYDEWARKFLAMTKEIESQKIDFHGVVSLEKTRLDHQKAMELTNIFKEKPSVLLDSVLFKSFLVPSCELELTSFKFERPEIQFEPFAQFDPTTIQLTPINIEIALIPISETSDETKQD